MSEKTNVKTFIIAIIAIIAICIVGIIVAKTIITNNDKRYELEKIAEEDYKYFVVFTNDRYGVIDTTRQYDN